VMYHACLCGAPSTEAIKSTRNIYTIAVKRRRPLLFKYAMCHACMCIVQCAEHGSDKKNLPGILWLLLLLELVERQRPLF
jgi:hypothetical protein